VTPGDPGADLLAVSPRLAARGILELRAFRLPMTVRFRGVTERLGLLVRGPAGWGEFSPFAEYPPSVTRWWAACAVDAATRPAPTPLRDTIEVNATVPAVPAVEAHRRAAASGCRTAKVKVAEPGQDLTDDVERVAAVREALGPDGLVRVDANGAWDVATATQALGRLDDAAGGLEYAEQPCRTIEELADLRRRVSVPIAADESVRTAADPMRVAIAGAADLVVVKVQPLGGVERALAVVAAAGLPAVVSSALESSVGLSTGLALAAALPDLTHACGLATTALLAADVTSVPLTARGGRLRVRTVEPDEASLSGVHPGPEIAGDLVARFEAALDALDAGDDIGTDQTPSGGRR
jgi:o-succinylbenzoate synthase